MIYEIIAFYFITNDMDKAIHHREDSDQTMLQNLTKLVSTDAMRYPLGAVPKEHQLLRVIDESGEDYLYPVGYFVPIELPLAAEKVFSLF